MIFHLGSELPEKDPVILDEASPDLTSKEIQIIKEQIRKNSKLIGEYLFRLDLLVNKEKYPQRAVFLKKIRRRLELLIEENDTFRKVLWKHVQQNELKHGNRSV